MHATSHGERSLAIQVFSRRAKLLKPQQPEACGDHST